MATIIDLANYRQSRVQSGKHQSSFDPAPDRLWEYLTHNIKIPAALAGNSTGNKSK